MPSEDNFPDIETEKLSFDSENPRLAEYGVNSKTSQFELLKILWENLAVREVALSIAHNGYFRNEPLFVEKHGKNRFVVIEGNRRLAAIQLLLSEDLRKRLRATDLPVISAARRKELGKLPVLHTTRREAWSQLGFKHVNGPATWGSYAKAQYIAKVHNDYGVSLLEIARRIGDYHSTVERMYHGLMVIEQAEKAKLNITLVSSRLSKLRNAQTRSFRPGSKGCRFEVDYHFRLAA
jgi:hypothetical protein